jgi:DNA-directed RNA polymerase specialized sigma24 family protein
VGRLLGDDCPIDDGLQEVWLAALSRLARLRSPAAFRVWLYRIARNQVCSALRRRHAWADLPDDDLAAAAGEFFHILAYYLLYSNVLWPVLLVAAAGMTVVFVLKSRQATLRQIQATLDEISRQIEAQSK